MLVLLSEYTFVSVIFFEKKKKKNHILNNKVVTLVTHIKRQQIYQNKKDKRSLNKY